MTGKLRGIFLVLVVLSVAATAQASPFFPFARGYTATYSGSQGGQTWTAKLQFTGSTYLDGYQWWNMNLVNWNGDGTTRLRYARGTETAVYSYDSSGGPDFQTGPIGYQWTYTDHQGNLQTVTIVDITSVTVPAGTFQDVYEFHTYHPGPEWGHDEYMYWKPGIGLIKDVDYDFTNPLTMELISLTRGTKTAGLGLLLDN
jgi:hypothetical protein